MTEEYSYYGECETTICPCGSIHPWIYSLEPCATCKKKGCYDCQEKCDFCFTNVCAGERVKYEGCDVCEKCKIQAEKEDKMVEQVVMELAA